MHFLTWPRSFYKPCSKKLGLNFWVPISFQRYKNTSRYDTDCSPLVELPPGESPQIYRFFPFIFSINQSFICRRNYLFGYPHEHMTSFQYLATPKYVSFFRLSFKHKISKHSEHETLRV